MFMVLGAFGLVVVNGEVLRVPLSKGINIHGCFEPSSSHSRGQVVDCQAAVISPLESFLLGHLTCKLHGNVFLAE